MTIGAIEGVLVVDVDVYVMKLDPNGEVNVGSCGRTGSSGEASSRGGEVGEEGVLGTPLSVVGSVGSGGTVKKKRCGGQ